jgi:hypothetical protein
VLDFREEEVSEIVDADTPAGTSGSASAQAAVAAAASENAKKEAGLSGNRSASYQSLSGAAKAGTDGAAGANGGGMVTSTSFEAKDASGEEITRSATQIFNPTERIRRVFEKILEDPYSVSFQDPVDIDVYTDYLDIVEEPMCLKDIQRKLDGGEYSKYGQYTKFAQDMRKIWRNCKAYNLYKSQIWHSAHALGMMFERLYQAWVVAFSDGSVPLSDPLARPWEMSCRGCMEEGHDDQMLLCDHCDANHHIYCLRPPLSKVPEDAWMCPRCIQWFARTGAKMLSAAAEDDARALAEGANARKVVQVRKKKYLVKWRGLSYRECTWETAKDIGDDALIAEYHKLNDSPPDEPPLTQAELGVELAKDRKNPTYPAGINMGRENPIMDLDAQIYAQIRAYHFLKWNKTAPEALLRECGPAAYGHQLGVTEDLALPAYVRDAVDATVAKAAQIEAKGGEIEEESTAEGKGTKSSDNAASTEEGESEEKPSSSAMDVDDEGSTVKKEGEDGDESVSAAAPKEVLDRSLRWYATEGADPIVNIVADRLAEMVYSVARDTEKAPLTVYPSRPTLPSRYQVPSEIEVCVAKGDQSLLLRVGNYHGNVIVTGFRAYDPYGNKGPVERTGRVRMGDLLVAIDGVYVHDLKYAKILKLLASRQPYMYLRFLRVPACVEARSPDFIVKYMTNKSQPRSSHRPFPLRSRYFGVFPAPVAAATADSAQADDADGSGSVNGDASRGDKAPAPTRWVAEYFRNFEKKTIGEFDTEDDAARAYDKAVAKEWDAPRRIRNFASTGSAELTPPTEILRRVVDSERRVTALRVAQYQRRVAKHSASPATAQALKQMERDAADADAEAAAGGTGAEDFHSYDSRDSVSDASQLSSPAESESEDDEQDRRDEVSNMFHLLLLGVIVASVKAVRPTAANWRRFCWLH